MRMLSHDSAGTHGRPYDEKEPPSTPFTQSRSPMLVNSSHPIGWIVAASHEKKRQNLRSLRIENLGRVAIAVVGQVVALGHAAQIHAGTDKHIQYST